MLCWMDNMGLGDDRRNTQKGQRLDVKRMKKKKVVDYLNH